MKSIRRLKFTKSRHSALLFWLERAKLQCLVQRSFLGFVQEAYPMFEIDKEKVQCFTFLAHRAKLQCLVQRSFLGFA